MNYKYIVLLFVIIGFTQCSKKAADKAISEATVTKKVESFRSMAPNAGPARNVEIGDYSSFDLANGLKVIVVENHKLPIVSYQVSLLNPPLLEGNKVGFVSMTGDLIKTGTANRTKSQIDETIDFYGANLNTSSTGIFLSSLKKHSDPLMEIFTDILENPIFPQDEFEKAKNQVVSGLASQKTDPNSISSNVGNSVLYGKGHPYGEVQTELSTSNFTLDDCKNYYNTYFKPNNSYLIIVGDITVDEAKSKAEKYFSSWKSGTIPNYEYAQPAGPKGKKVAFAHKDGAVQSVIKVTYPVDLHPKSDDVLKATTMNQILGGGAFSGRLMQNLREDKAYTYGARSQLSSDPLVGAFSAGASVRNEVTDSSIYEILFEMERMVTEPVEAKALQLIKNSMAGSFARSLESPQTIARFAKNIYKYDLPKDYYGTYLSRLDEITPEDITAMAKKYIKPSDAYIVVVGNKDEVADKLLKYDSDGVIDFYGAYGEAVNYNAIALPEGTTAMTVIEDYINAIGGKEKLSKVTTLTTNGGMMLMGQEASLIIKVKSPNKYLNKMKMGDMIMQEQKCDGMKASISGMGQTEVFGKGDPQFDQIMEETTLFDQLNYKSEIYALELKGIEKLNGEDCYKIVVTKNDNKETQFYSIKTSLLVGSVVAEPEGDNPGQIISTNLSDYKEVNGIMLPFTMTIIGAAPFPLEMKMTSYEVNTDIPDSEFQIK